MVLYFIRTFVTKKTQQYLFLYTELSVMVLYLSMQFNNLKMKSPLVFMIIILVVVIIGIIISETPKFTISKKYKDT